MSKQLRSVKYVRTDVVFVTFNDDEARKIIEEISRRYKVIKAVRSKVVKELYFVSIEGTAEGVEEYLRRDSVKWRKKDLVIFR